MEISLQAFLAIWIPKKRKWLKRKKSERKKGLQGLGSQFPKPV